MFKLTKLTLLCTLYLPTCLSYFLLSRILLTLQRFALSNCKFMCNPRAIQEANSPHRTFSIIFLLKKVFVMIDKQKNEYLEENIKKMNNFDLILYFMFITQIEFYSTMPHLVMLGHIFKRCRCICRCIPKKENLKKKPENLKKKKQKMKEKIPKSQKVTKMTTMQFTNG